MGRSVHFFLSGQQLPAYWAWRDWCPSTKIGRIAPAVHPTGEDEKPWAPSDPAGEGCLPMRRYLRGRYLDGRRRKSPIDAADTRLRRLDRFQRSRLRTRPRWTAPSPGDRPAAVALLPVNPSARVSFLRAGNWRMLLRHAHLLWDQTHRRRLGAILADLRWAFLFGLGIPDCLSQHLTELDFSQGLRAGAALLNFCHPYTWGVADKVSMLRIRRQARRYARVARGMCLMTRMPLKSSHPSTGRKT